MILLRECYCELRSVVCVTEFEVDGACRISTEILLEGNLSGKKWPLSSIVVSNCSWTFWWKVVTFRQIFSHSPKQRVAYIIIYSGAKLGMSTGKNVHIYVLGMSTGKNVHIYVVRGGAVSHLQTFLIIAFRDVEM